MCVLLCAVFLIILKIFCYLLLTFVILALALKLWLEPIKGVCNCKARMDGKTVLVTGGNSGIELETANDLARRGARVIIASRNILKSKEAVENVIKVTKNKNVECMELDLSKFSDIRRFAAEFSKKEDRLDVLVNNAGAGGVPQKPTKDGIDLVMQINYFGPFLLTNLLLDKLVSSRPSRIVNVSSYGHKFTNLDIEDLRGLKNNYYFLKYCNSKLCQVLWTKALAARLPNDVTVNCLHPGVVKTDIFDKLHPWLRKTVHFLLDLLFKTAREGAQTSIHLCVAPELQNATGGYYSDCQPSTPTKYVKDEDLIERIWIESKKITDS